MSATIAEVIAFISDKAQYCRWYLEKPWWFKVGWEVAMPVQMVLDVKGKESLCLTILRIQL